MTISSLPLTSDAATIARHSRTVSANGFSQSTGSPRSKASTLTWGARPAR